MCRFSDKADTNRTEKRLVEPTAIAEKTIKIFQKIFFKKPK